MDSYWYLLVLKILKHSLHVETVEILHQTIALLSWGLTYRKANVEVNNGCLCLSTYYFESNWFCKYSMCMKLTKFWKRYFRLKKNYAFSKIDFQHQPPPISPSKYTSLPPPPMSSRVNFCWAGARKLAKPVNTSLLTPFLPIIGQDN